MSDEQRSDAENNMRMNGPWFVLWPDVMQGLPLGTDSDGRFRAQKCEGESEAMTLAQEKVREGHPFVYAGRGIYEMSVPIQARVLLEATPGPGPLAFDPDAPEEEGE